MKTKQFLACFLIAGSLFVSACDKAAERQKQSTVSVFGTGTVLARPDMIQMSITLSKVAQTTKAAQDEVSGMVRQVLTILKDANIEDKNITTASLNFRSEYEYTNRRTLIGQRAEQMITFSIDDIANNSEKASGIIDRLIRINGIELNQVNFSIKNNTEYFIASRELAFQKAVEKANQYAELSKLKIIKVLSITEEGNQQISSMNNRLLNQKMVYEAQAADDSGSTVLPTGELEITTKILVVFLLE
jgi:uncharacterized protein YggE